MGFMRILAISLVVLIAAWLVKRQLTPPPEVEPVEWKNYGNQPTEVAQKVTQPRKFQIKYTANEVRDFKSRLNQTRYPPVMSPEVKMTYGYPSSALKDLAQTMMNFDWKKWQKELNKYDQYLVNIMGLDIHYVHIKGKPGLPVTPLLLIHGWPGSFYEFYKSVPHLLKLAEDNKFTYDIVIPSLPGFGYSEAAKIPGCNGRYAAAIFAELMTRLGYDKFVCQGGDFGSVITEFIVGLYPERIIGFHINMFVAPFFISDLRVLPIQLLCTYFPSVFMSPEEVEIANDKGLFTGYSSMLPEGGYAHIQATKPDTVGVGLTDSPLGLAAYILEKFYTATNTDTLEQSMEEATASLPMSMDELLTNVLIYWHSNSIQSSVRLYKEHIAIIAVPPFVTTDVPSAVLMNKHEGAFSPELLVRLKHLNLKQYTPSSQGGHFAAFERPESFSEDVVTFTKQLLTNASKDPNKSD